MDIWKQLTTIKNPETQRRSWQMFSHQLFTMASPICWSQDAGSQVVNRRSSQVKIIELCSNLWSRCIIVVVENNKWKLQPMKFYISNPDLKAFLTKWYVKGDYTAYKHSHKSCVSELFI